MNNSELLLSGAFNKEIPADYTHLLSQDEYNKMLSLVMQYFDDKGEKVVSLLDGFLTVTTENNEELKFGFDNLVRSVAASKPENRESVIYTHFNKINFSAPAYNYFFKDYPFAKDFLKVVIKHEEILAHKAGKDLVYRVDFPGTCTILVMDYDNQLRFLRHEDITGWEITVEELFSVALENIACEKITASTMVHPEGFTFYSYLSGDFAAAWMVELLKNAPDSIGKFGALVAIPTKGAAFSSPINHNRVMDLVSIIAPMIFEFYEKEPGNITSGFYWFYRGTFEKFPMEEAGNQRVKIRIPETLEKLIQSKIC